MYIDEQVVISMWKLLTPASLILQRLGQIAQFGQRCLELDVAHIRQLHGRHDGEFWLGFDWVLHSGLTTVV